MNQNVRRILAVAVAFIIAFGWYVTIFGVGPVAPLKDKIKLGLDIKGGVFVVMEAKTDAKGEELSKLMEQTQAVIEERVNQMGLSEPVVTIEGERRIRVELPGAENAQEAIDSIGKTAQLQFVMADGRIILDGGNVEDAGIAQDSKNGGYVVTLQFDKEGAKLFEEATKLAISGQVKATQPGAAPNTIMIILDGQVISAPGVSDVISGGKCEISKGGAGGFPQKEAVETAILIRGGALPVELTEVMTSNQTAKIGFDALEKSVIAGFIGLALIFTVMLLGYRMMGLVANIALLLYVLIVMWIMVILGSVLTLPGIAGIILSVGMAVDANVIIFSRIKEEISNGKSIRVSIQAGFKRAMSTVLDSQVTTMIAAVVLYQAGSSTVKGFAMTLMIGIIASIFTAVVITQLYLGLVGESKRFAKKAYFGMNEDNSHKIALKREFNFIKHRKKFYIASIVLIVAGLAVGGVRGFNYGIDFTGGTMMQVDMGQQVAIEEVQKVLSDNGIKAEVIYAGENHQEVIIRTTQSLDNDTRGALLDSMQSTFDIESTNIPMDQFGPSVGKELQKNAVLAVVIASIGMLIYIIIRFEWKFGVAALAGVAHDVLLVIAFYAIFQVTINNPFIAGVLTVVGYSINDTIVIFDRIRENLGLMKKTHTEALIDKSINQTLVRSLMTSFTTVIVMIPLYVLTGPAIREFVLPLIVGVLVGAISSICVCSPLYYEFSTLTGGSKYKAKSGKSRKGGKDYAREFTVNKNFNKDTDDEK